MNTLLLNALMGCAKPPAVVPMPEPPPPLIEVDLPEPSCVGAWSPGRRVERWSCVDRTLTLDVTDIGSEAIRLTPGPLTVVLSSWRLEGVALLDGERLLCNEFGCEAAGAQGVLEKTDERWTWTVALPQAPETLTVNWIDAYRR